eukprot:scaffold2420_cov85-Phaeocystis_antarctica.AAC.1
MMHFTGGEIIPRWVLCPWRAHLLASTLPAVARATAACFVRCAWMVWPWLRSPEGYTQWLVCQVLARTREPRKRRSGRLSAPVAGTPNNGRAAVRRAPDTSTTACIPQET